MAIAVFHEGKNRFYVRKFDHDEARARFAAGETIAELCVAYDVSDGAVRRVVDPAFAAASKARQDAWSHTRCEGCGKRCLRADHANRRTGVRALCVTCIAKESRENVSLNIAGEVLRVWCSTCESWKPPEAFGKGLRYRDLRAGGFHKACRPCGTALRTEYRNRHKVPCSVCGKPCEGKGRPNSRIGSNGKRVALDPDRPFLYGLCSRPKPKFVVTTPEAGAEAPRTRPLTKGKAISGA